jgi:hypothetical protein
VLQTSLATAAALVALLFALSAFERWLGRRAPYELAWSFALLLFCLAAATLAAGAAAGWSAVLFRAFYFLGAVANVPVLAVGTVFLVGGPRWGRRGAVAVAVGVAFAAGVIAIAPLTGDVPENRLPKGSEVFGVLPRALAAIASGGGAAVVLGGAVWSGWRLRFGARFWSNMLVALGTIVLSASGLLNSVLGEMEAFSVTLLAGVILIFAGFVVGTLTVVPGVTEATLAQTGVRRAASLVS